jgi:hypothetical protein
MQKLESSKHKAVRTYLRVAGPVAAVTGLIFIIVAFADFVRATNNILGDSPKYFWCFFVGMPLLFVGIVMSSLGYVGAATRYMAAETTPVAKDTVNYMAEGTQEGVKTVARAITEGIKEAQERPPTKDPSKS